MYTGAKSHTFCSSTFSIFAGRKSVTGYVDFFSTSSDVVVVAVAYTHTPGYIHMHAHTHYISSKPIHMSLHILLRCKFLPFCLFVVVVVVVQLVLVIYLSYHGRLFLFLLLLLLLLFCSCFYLLGIFPGNGNMC